MKITDTLKAQAGVIKANFTEWYTLLLLIIGVPAIVYIYFDWKAALATSIVIQATLGVLAVGNRR